MTEVTEATLERPRLRWWVAVLGGMSALAAVAFHPLVWAKWRRLVPWLPRLAYQAGWVAAAGTHVYKGQRARRRAEAAGLADAVRWGRQSLVLGAPSDWLLAKRLAGAHSAAELTADPA
jgi:hypothetical protein